VSYFKFVDVSSLEDTSDRLSEDDWLGHLFVAVDDECNAGISCSLSSQRQHLPVFTYISQIHTDLVRMELTNHLRYDDFI